MKVASGTAGWSVGAAIAILTGCVYLSGNGDVPDSGIGDVPEFRDEVLGHVTHLREGWEDWLSLLRASDVVEGVFQIDDPEGVKGKPEQYLDARIERPRMLLGRPQTEDRTFRLFNATIRRWRYSPMYSWQIEQSIGRRCIAFLNGRHIARSSVGIVMSITVASELTSRQSELESFLYLAKLDPVQVADLVAKKDSRVEHVVEQLRLATGDRAAVQSCYDDLRRMGVEALPGILHAMMDVLLNRKSNPELEIEWIFDERYMNPNRTFDLLQCRAGHLVRLGPPPEHDEARWRDIRIVALHLLASATSH